MSHKTVNLIVTKFKEKYSGDLKSEHVKSGLFEGPISNGPVFKWLSFGYSYSIAPTIRKPEHSKYGLFLDFKWFLAKWRPFVGISNGWASGFQILFEIWIICNLTPFNHLKSRLVHISDRVTRPSLHLF